MDAADTLVLFYSSLRNKAMKVKEICVTMLRQSVAGRYLALVWKSKMEGAARLHLAADCVLYCATKPQRLFHQEEAYLFPPSP